MSKTPNLEKVEACFRAIVAAAIEGKRCPENDTQGVSSYLTTFLAREGRIRIEISGHNYRRIVILTGDHAGKATAPDPTGRKPWKILDTETRVNGKTIDAGTSGRRQPSAPRLMTSAELDRVK